MKNYYKESQRICLATKLTFQYQRHADTSYPDSFSK